MENDNPRLPGRRTLVAGIAGSLATAAAALSTPAQAQTGGATMPPPAPLADPRDMYYKPPFESQSQPWPGLTSKMTPVPDHGERSYVGRGRLAGRRALITGGDSGIGRAVAIAFAREGADVAISYLEAEEQDAREVEHYIKESGRRAILLPGDIRSEDHCKKLVSDAANALGSIDILVNNAGRQQSHDSILDISTDQFDWTFRTNVYAMFWITKAAIPLMVPGSAIINTTSVNAYDPGENLLDYSMTKGSILIFTKALAKQMVKKGIRVNGVAPGPFWTALQVTGGQTQKKIMEFGTETPLGRPGQPAEIATVYVELASSGSTYLTGQIYGANGGMGLP